jgi:hypothetical protein
MIQVAQEQGIEAEEVEALLAGIGLNRSNLDDPDTWVTINDEHALMYRISSLVPDPAFGLNLAQRYHIGLLGKLVLAAMSCNTFLEAIQLAFKFYELMAPDFQYILQAQGSRASLSLREVMDMGAYLRLIHEGQAVKNM